MPGMKQTMHEWKTGTLHSGSKTGPVVRSQKQALAIEFSEEREAAKNKKFGKLKKLLHDHQKKAA